MNPLAGMLAAITFFAVLIERLLEKGLKPLPGVSSAVVTYAAFGLGIVVAVVFGLDGVALVLFQFGRVEPYPLAGVILTGLVIGGGSNFVSDIFGLVRGENPTPPNVIVHAPAAEVTVATHPPDQPPRG